MREGPERPHLQGRRSATVTTHRRGNPQPAKPHPCSAADIVEPHQASVHRPVDPDGHRCCHARRMNRRTLDMVIPMLYVVAILIAVFFAGGKAVGAVCAIGAILVGMYWAGIPRNLKN